MQLTPIRLLNVTAPLASGHNFVSAASGLVRVGGTLYVVGDDEQHLALFTNGDDAPGQLLRLLSGDLPRKKKKRKAVKPDFEILFRLPSGELCAMGSGSTARRMRGVLINLDDHSVTVRGLQPLFAAIAALVADINLEGAVAQGDRLLLFNRGNMTNPETTIVETSLAAISGDAPAEIRVVKTLVLPMIGGVPLTVTDACLLDDGRLLCSAVAEATDDSYGDGVVLGCAMILLSADFDVVAVEPVEQAVKIEGISARQTADGIELLCVSDADDPGTPSSLYAATMHI